MDKPDFNSLPPLQRNVVLLIGHISVLLGGVALILPIIPTTPFLLVGVACYARTSEKFYNKLLENKYCGPAIKNWRYNRCIERKSKIGAVALMIVVFSSSSLLFLDNIYARLVMFGIGAIVIVTLLFIPTCNKHQQREQE